MKMKDDFDVVIACVAIAWDTDGDDADALDLPNSVVIENPTDEMIADCDEYNDAITNYLSDKYGFCIEGCHIYKCRKANVMGKKQKKQSALVGGTYAIQLQLKKPVDDGTFFRFVVVNQANEEKAKFWFTKSISGDIYTVTACFTDERYSWIQLYVEVDVTEGTNRYYPTEAYMSTYSLKMTTDQCRDIIRYFTEASEVCDVITKFFKKEAIK